ncbi:MAG TPA: hypothetical protein PLH39_00505 [Promineifilum sp.]|nr:hypothetical protein [Promineifilum sp.]
MIRRPLRRACALLPDAPPALAESDPTEAFYAIDAAHMLAIVAPPPEALAWNRRAPTNWLLPLTGRAFTPNS